MPVRFAVRSIALVVAIVCTGVLARGDESKTTSWRLGSSRLGTFPPVMFWAWHRPEDLRGLTPQRAGVAFLAATWTLEADGPRIERRRQPLLVDPGTPLLAVVRVETGPEPLHAYSARQIRSMAVSMAEIVDSSRAGGLQIDYDATASEREFYRQLLDETRVALGDRPLSMTALVSWCLEDAPLLSARVDEVVPMLFQLGVPDAERLKARGAARALRSKSCAAAVGVSTDEPTPALGDGRRVYIFNPSGWTPAAARRALNEIAQWH
jgi:hypothetical protein